MGTRPLGRMLLCQEEEEENTEASVVPTPLGPLRETYCQKHSEKIYFFCKTDAEFLCVFCRAGPAHRTHSMGFLDEAIRPYRDHLRSQLEVLRVKRDKIENIKCREDQKLQGLLALIENKKQQVETAFERLYQELGDQQRLLLARMRGLEQQIWKERDEYITKVSKEVAQVEAQVEELKQKCQRPGSELVQDVRVYQSRCEKTFVNPEAISSDLAKKILELHRKILILPDMMKTFSENLVQHLETDSEFCVSSKLAGNAPLTLVQPPHVEKIPRQRRRVSPLGTEGGVREAVLGCRVAGPTPVPAPSPQ